MKKYIQLQDSYDNKKGDIWEELGSFENLVRNTRTGDRMSITVIASSKDWFAPYDEKKEYAKKWEDLKEISGSLVDSLSNISGTLGLDTIYQHRNIYSTENQARAALAEAQLSQLLKEIYEGEGWKPDWKDYKQIKWSVVSDKEDNLCVMSFLCVNSFIALPTLILAERFLENHRELIETYYKKFEW